MASTAEQNIAGSELKSQMAKSQMLSWIRTGRWRSGQKIPSERALASALKVTAGTVRRGMGELVSEGLIVKKPRVGNFVGAGVVSKRVCIALPKYHMQKDPQHPASSLYIGGTSEVLNHREYLFCTFPYRPRQLWTDVGTVAIGSGIAGMIVVPEHDMSAEDLQRITDSGIKVVVLGYHAGAQKLGLPHVTMDHSMTIRQILNKFVELGHREIVVVRQQFSVFRELENQVLEELCKRHHLGALEDIVLEFPNQDEEPDYGPLREIFTRDIKPTAILASDEFVASEIFRICWDRGIRIPDDVSLASRWDSAPLMHAVPLTAPDSASICREAAKRSAQMLADLLHNRPSMELSVTFRCDVQWKDSVGPVKGR